MLTILDIVRRTTEFFRKAGVPNPRLDAELLVGFGLGLRREQLYIQFDRPLEEEQLREIRKLVKRRANREPLQYIVGEKDFNDLRLKVDSRALIPRPETEELFELAASLTQPARILDLGTGTGALILALIKRFPDAEGLAVDSSAEALALAAENADRNGLKGKVRWKHSDWYSGIKDEGRFDLIVSNPPYLSEEEWATAQPEVREYEPREALVADQEGREALEEIIRGAMTFLTSDGVLALETGIAQHETLAKRAHQAGFTYTDSYKDLSGRDRFFVASQRKIGGKNE